LAAYLLSQDSALPIVFPPGNKKVEIEQSFPACDPGKMFRIRRDGQETARAEIKCLGINSKFSLSLEDVDDLLMGM
jgi:hypothetical protein